MVRIFRRWVWGLAAWESACGMFGARLQHLLVHQPQHLKSGAWHELWKPGGGGGSVFGGLIGDRAVVFCGGGVASAFPRPSFGLHWWRHSDRGILDSSRLRVQRLLCGPRNEGHFQCLSA